MDSQVSWWVCCSFVLWTNINYDVIGWSKEMSRGLDQQMYFIVHLQNDKRVQKSQSTDIFSFVLEGVYANFYLTAAANSPSDEQGKGTREEQEGLQSNFYKACLSAGTLEHFCCRGSRGNIENYDILSGLHGCRDPSREASFQEQVPARFGFSYRPSHPANTLCASYFLLFCHHNKRVQQ